MPSYYVDSIYDGNYHALGNGRGGVSVARHVLVAFSNAIPGKEAEYNEWYSKQHIPDVLQIPGFISARRYSLSDCQLPGMSFDRKYLVVYEIDANDPQPILEELSRRLGTSAMVVSEALAPDVLAVAFSAIESRREAPSWDI